MNLEQFDALARSRRSMRRFRPDPVDPALLERLLDIAHWAPSGYNLQPTHFVLVTDARRKQALHRACLNQRQVIEAPATVVFTGDRRVVEHNFAQVLAAERQAGAINADYEKTMHRFVTLAFGTGPVGLGWLWKATLAPLLGWVSPVPEIPAVRRSRWLAKQVSLTAMQFMLAAEAAGLATVPMEGFSQRGVRRALGIPRWHEVVLVVPVGYAASVGLKKTRLPLARMLHRDGW